MTRDALADRRMNVIFFKYAANHGAILRVRPAESFRILMALPALCDAT
jgi:hypothetical protein